MASGSSRKWPQVEMVIGIAAGKPLTLAGSAVPLVHFCDIDSRLPDVEVLVRCKIFPNGSTDWHGLIIGAEALDCKERGGLAHRVTERAHVFDGIGVRCLRTETLNSGRVDQAYAVHIVHPAHPVAFVSPSAVDSDEEEDTFMCKGCHRTCRSRSTSDSYVIYQF